MEHSARRPPSRFMANVRAHAQRCQWPARSRAMLAAVLLWPLGASADAVSVMLRGAYASAQEGGCIWVAVFYYKIDCSPEGRQPRFAGRALSWVGPLAQGVYYPRDSRDADPTHVPAVKDSRVAPGVAATFTIDDVGTADPADDRIIGRLEIGPAARSTLSRGAEGTRLRRIVQSWRRAVHEFPATAVTSVAVDAATGSREYVIAQRGFPPPLCRAAVADDCFPSAAAPVLMDGQYGTGIWRGPIAVGYAASSFLGGNVGVATRAILDDYKCSDSADGQACRESLTVWQDDQESGFDNLLVRLRVSRGGKPLDATLYWTQEYRVGAGPLRERAPAGEADSWVGGRIELRPP